MKRPERNNAMNKMQTENPMRLNDSTKNVGAQYFVPDGMYSIKNVRSQYNVESDEFVVMPNHINGIMIINGRAHDKKNGHKILCPYGMIIKKLFREQCD